MTRIRFATAADASQIAQLLQQIFCQMGLVQAAAITDTDFQTLTAKVFSLPTVRCEAGTTLVAAEGSKVLGVAYGYPQESEPHLARIWNQRFNAAAVIPHETMEAEAQEWYLEALATHPQFQGRGLGSRLIDAVKQEATNQGFRLVGLNVDQQNPQARKLYNRHGFVTTGQKQIAGHQYEHLQAFSY